MTYIPVFAKCTAKYVKCSFRPMCCKPNVLLRWLSLGIIIDGFIDHVNEMCERSVLNVK